MSDRQPENRPRMNDWEVLLTGACIALPMLFFGVIQVWVVGRNDDRFLQAAVDGGLAVVGLVLLRWSRRWPWQIAAGTAILTVGSAMALGPAYGAYLLLCRRRRWRQIIPVAALSLLCLLAQYSWLSFGGQQRFLSMATGTLALGGLTALGLFLRSRTDLQSVRREQLLAAERAREQLIEQAKLSERAQIAREMHDVLAHRISLLSMLAGGLAYRSDLTPEQTRETALAIQENAHQSLTELRSVLGTLRSDGSPEAPQPTLADLAALFDEVRTAGQGVEVTDTIVDRELLPTQIGRHAYRVVQEALTNARKHAPGHPVTVELAGQIGEGLRIEVSNATPFRAASGAGAKLGLVGLAERTRLAGGSISQLQENGRFVLTARLPWEA